jgi:hypothetical protein
MLAEIASITRHREYRRGSSIGTSHVMAQVNAAVSSSLRKHEAVLRKGAG